MPGNPAFGSASAGGAEASGATFETLEAFVPSPSGDGEPSCSGVDEQPQALAAASDSQTPATQRLCSFILGSQWNGLTRSFRRE
jgi:hypothetical protein